jgi:hypothetical protein
MPLQIQPPEVQKKNAKLIALAFVLSIPFYWWVWKSDLNNVPRWLPITVLGLNFCVVVPCLIVARRYLNRKKDPD